VKEIKSPYLDALVNRLLEPLPKWQGDTDDKTTDGEGGINGTEGVDSNTLRPVLGKKVKARKGRSGPGEDPRPTGSD